MGKATAAATGAVRRGVFDVDEGRALEALRLAWGEAYGCGFADGVWHACRHGGGDLLSGSTPDELNVAIRADWASGSAR